MGVSVLDGMVDVSVAVSKGVVLSWSAIIIEAWLMARWVRWMPICSIVSLVWRRPAVSMSRNW